MQAGTHESNFQELTTFEGTIEHPTSDLVQVEVAWQQKRSIDSVVSEHSLRAAALVVSDGPVTKYEIWGWYCYDWANSPFWQVADTINAWFLKRLAEYSKSRGGFNVGISAGSYPATIVWITAASQVVCLLSFSAFGDYGPYRKRLLQIITFLGSFMLSLSIFCFSGDLWWLAGLIRIGAGLCFVLCNVYYNSYLPLLTSQHPEVLSLQGVEADHREVRLSDEISAKGFGLGYAGGFSMQMIAFMILFLFECDSDCTEFDRLFWFGLCVMLVGMWWCFFSLFTFRHLKTRAGPSFPEGNNILCLGWIQAWKTLCMVVKRKNVFLFMIAYFLWSDALNTTLNVSILYLEEKEDDSVGDTGKDSTKMMFVGGATLMGLLGVFSLMKFQQLLKLNNQRMLLGLLSVYAIVTVACACGALSNGILYYICMLPVAMMSGCLQANTRSLYSSLSPVGMEAAMFSFYAITDKGSTLMGAAVIAVIHTSTGSYVGVFWYCALAFVVSAAILSFVDVDQGMLDAGKHNSNGDQKPSTKDEKAEASVEAKANTIGQSDVQLAPHQSL